MPLTAVELWALPESEKIQHQLEVDYLYDKIPRNEREKVKEEAVRCGQREAEALKKKYPHTLLEEILTELNIEVIFERLPLTDEFASVAYFQLPNQLVINKTLILEAEVICTQKKSELPVEVLTYLNPSFWLEVVMAHELFHYLQQQKPALMVNTYRVKLWQIPFYTHTSPIAALSEIGATAFAKVLLGLEHYPAFLENLLVEHLTENI